MLAQRFPTAYDGIAAGAPAIHWTEFFPSMQWPQQVMNELDKYPFGCEMDAITAAAVEACDRLDGVVDGVISHVDDCLGTFDPFSIVGKSVQCAQINKTAMRVSHSAAVIVSATWRGMSTTDGKRIWHGLNPGSDLTGNSPASYGQPGVAATANCSTSGCRGAPNILGLQWLQLFIARAPAKDISNLTRADFIDFVNAGRQQFTSIIGTTDADLSRFRDAGGKLISFHGLVSCFGFRVLLSRRQINTPFLGRWFNPSQGYGAVLQRSHGCPPRHSRFLPLLRSAGTGALFWRRVGSTHSTVSAAASLGRERNRSGKDTRKFKRGRRNTPSNTVSLSQEA